MDPEESQRKDEEDAEREESNEKTIVSGEEVIGREGDESRNRG